MSSHAPSSESSQTLDNPTAIIVSVLGRQNVIIIGLTSLAVGLISLVAGILWPVLYDNPISRYSFTALVSLATALAFFIIFPHPAKASSETIGWAVTGLAGPIVLFIAFFFILNNALPDLSGRYRYYNVLIKSPAGRPFEITSINFTPEASSGEVIKVPDDYGNLKGLVVKFTDDGRVRATVEHKRWRFNPNSIEFSAATSNNVSIIATPNNDQEP